MRLGFAGDRQHLFRHRHLEIHTCIQRLTQDTNVAIGDMTAVFTQMNGNAVGASLFGNKCRLNRIRISRASRITQRGNVINVDA
ncbi:hypothetical protein D3C71_1283230 [compost metagenome]